MKATLHATRVCYLTPNNACKVFLRTRYTLYRFLMKDVPMIMYNIITLHTFHFSFFVLCMYVLRFYRARAVLEKKREHACKIFLSQQTKAQ